MDRRRSLDGRVKKRKAENTLSDDRLTKRLESLKLGLHIPLHSHLKFTCFSGSVADYISGDIEAQTKVRPQLYAHIQRRPSAPSSPPLLQDVATNTVPTASTEDDSMDVEETKNRVYISNLEKEIAEIEAAEEAARKTIFIPDIDKKILERGQRIPLGVYANKDGEIGGLNRDQALVLYDFPKSLSLPESKDSARKAILEARRRAQEKAGLATDGRATSDPPAFLDMDGNADLELDDGVEPMAIEDDNEEDGDVMEIDEEL